MDPLTALSTVGTVLQFVDFGSKLISSSVKLYKNGQLDVHQQAISATNDILDYSVKLQRNLRISDEPAILTKDEELLESICEECDNVAHDLLGRLKELSVPRKDKNGREKVWPTLTAAFRSIWTEEYLDETQERLKEYRRQIDSRVIQSLSKQVNLKFLEHSERFDRLDAANKDIATALVSRNTSDSRALQTQFAALSTLLDRAEAVVTSQENANQRMIVDLFSKEVFTSKFGKDTGCLDQIREKEKKIRNSISTQILQSLHFETIFERFLSVDENHPTTFDWIFQPVRNLDTRKWSDFRSWLESGTDIYWINGKAGSGKSTLMKYIVNHRESSSLLRRWAGESKLCIGSFFFWNSGTSLQCSQAGLFRSLLHDILSRYPELIPTVLPTQWATRYSAECHDGTYQQEVWDLSKLHLAFRTLVSQTNSSLKICLFIDGLDEYEGNEADIAEIFSRASISENVKICCSSRPHLPFENAFGNRPGLRLQDLTMSDMKQYVCDKLEKSDRMQELRQREPKETENLVNEVASAANGVFLWVRLVVMSLLRGLSNHDDIGHLKMRLKMLPKELDDLFDRMIFKVDEVYRQETAQIFQLIDSTYRPRTDDILHGAQGTAQLSILLLSFAMERDNTLALQAEPSSFDEENIASRCKSMEIHLKTRSGGLLEVQYGSQPTALSPSMKITYLHRTVRDHLEQGKVRRMLERQISSEHQDPFHASSAIFKAHILALKAIHVTGLTSRWTLSEDGVAWARRAERHTGTSQPALIDAFYNIVCHRLKSTDSSVSACSPLHYFLVRQQSVLTFATTCGLSRYLDAKLPQKVKGEESHSKLLDLALTPIFENNYTINLEVVSTLLSHGANPNECLNRSTSTPWQNFLTYLNTRALGTLQHTEQLHDWVPIITVLLRSRAYPYAVCLEPQKYATTRGKRGIDDSLWTLDEILERAFASDPQRLAEVMAALEKAKLDLDPKELRQEELRQEELRREQLRREDARQQELLKEKFRQEELRQKDLRREQLLKEKLRQEELHQGQLRQEASHQEELRQKELRREQLHREKLRQEELGQGELRRERLREKKSRQEELYVDELRLGEPRREKREKSRQGKPRQEEPRQEELRSETPVEEEAQNERSGMCCIVQ